MAVKERTSGTRKRAATVSEAQAAIAATVEHAPKNAKRTRWERLFDAALAVRKILEEEELGHGFNLDAEPLILRDVVDVVAHGDVDAFATRYHEVRNNFEEAIQLHGVAVLEVARAQAQRFAEKNPVRVAEMRRTFLPDGA